MTSVVPHTASPEHASAPGWRQSLGNGAAGQALLHIARAHAGTGNWATAHRWVKTMTADPVAADPEACLYRGAPAVAFVLRAAGLPAYRGVLRALDEHLAAITRTRLERAHTRLDRGELPVLREYDLINGLTGLGVCLLQSVLVDPNHRARDPLRDVLTYLVQLTGPITLDGATLPGWWTPTGPSGHPDPRWPGGHANLGMAHGIAGPLALLAATMISGITVAGQPEAIERTDRFLSSWRCGPKTSPWWPGLISRREWRKAAVDQPGPQRPSWCYGTPGLTHARHLAAQALDAPTRLAETEAALVACITDAGQLDQLTDASLCHGWAGLVHTARRTLARAEPGNHAAEALAQLEHRWRHHRTRDARELSECSGMLEGKTGIALTDLPPDAGWDLCLLTPAISSPNSIPSTPRGTR
ncbi:lanthionine synthetase C family protein [Amycolatopsis thermoflava]|uniref:lanthionine synthetase C family protein n=1 Tax=Amycolatopsis thermoflava TaxID=84480 RepID=UPI0036635AEF